MPKNTCLLAESNKVNELNEVKYVLSHCKYLKITTSPRLKAQDQGSSFTDLTNKTVLSTTMNSLTIRDETTMIVIPFGVVLTLLI